MTQLTTRDPVVALMWILMNNHHEVGTEYNHDGTRATHTFYRNHYDKLRVPIGVEGFHNRIHPNPRPHDDRMFAVTPAGKAWLTSQGQTWNRKAHP